MGQPDPIIHPDERQTFILLNVAALLVALLIVTVVYRLA